MCKQYHNILALAAVEIISNDKLICTSVWRINVIQWNSAFFRWTVTCDSVWDFAFAAEIETTLNAFWSGILYLINKPDIQKRTHKEIVTSVASRMFT